MGDALISRNYCCRDRCSKWELLTMSWRRMVNTWEGDKEQLLEAAGT